MTHFGDAERILDEELEAQRNLPDYDGGGDAAALNATLGPREVETDGATAAALSGTLIDELRDLKQNILVTAHGISAAEVLNYILGEIDRRIRRLSA